MLNLFTCFNNWRLGAVPLKELTPKEQSKVEVLSSWIEEGCLCAGHDGHRDLKIVVTKLPNYPLAVVKQFFQCLQSPTRLVISRELLHLAIPSDAEAESPVGVELQNDEKNQAVKIWAGVIGSKPLGSAFDKASVELRIQQLSIEQKVLLARWIQPQLKEWLSALPDQPKPLAAGLLKLKRSERLLRLVQLKVNPLGYSDTLSIKLALGHELQHVRQPHPAKPWCQWGLKFTAQVMSAYLVYEVAKACFFCVFSEGSFDLVEGLMSFVADHAVSLLVFPFVRLAGELLFRNLEGVRALEKDADAHAADFFPVDFDSTELAFKAKNVEDLLAIIEEHEQPFIETRFGVSWGRCAYFVNRLASTALLTTSLAARLVDALAGGPLIDQGNKSPWKAKHLLAAQRHVWSWISHLEPTRRWLDTQVRALGRERLVA